MTWYPWPNYHDLNLSLWHDSADLHHFCSQRTASKIQKRNQTHKRNGTNPQKSLWGKRTMGQVTMEQTYKSDNGVSLLLLARTLLGKHKNFSLVITTYHQNLQNSKGANNSKRRQQLQKWTISVPKTDLWLILSSRESSELMTLDNARTLSWSEVEKRE